MSLLRDGLRFGLSSVVTFVAARELIAMNLQSSQCLRKDGVGYSEAANPRVSFGELGFEWALFDETANNYSEQRISGYYRGADSCYYRIAISEEIE
ncbi:MAG: hypothetical protein WC069_01280 [Candidatus Shapirobacteria bacterium]